MKQAETSLRRSHPSDAMRGISILELLFSLIILGFLFSQAITLKAVNDRRQVARARADNLAAFQRVASQYFLSNRLAMEAAMSRADTTAQADHCQVGNALVNPTFTQAVNTTKYTCALDALWLKQKGVWPENLNIEVFPNTRLVAIFRIVGATSTTTQADLGTEMLVVLAPFQQGSYTGVSVPSDQLAYLQTARDALGATGGFVPYGNANQCATLDNGTTVTRFEACGNGWKLDLTNFLDYTTADQTQILKVVPTQ